MFQRHFRFVSVLVCISGPRLAVRSPRLFLLMTPPLLGRYAYPRLLFHPPTCTFPPFWTLHVFYFSPRGRKISPTESRQISRPQYKKARAHRTGESSEVKVPRSPHSSDAHPRVARGKFPDDNWSATHQLLIIGQQNAEPPAFLLFRPKSEAWSVELGCVTCKSGENPPCWDFPRYGLPEGDLFLHVWILVRVLVSGFGGGCFRSCIRIPRAVSKGRFVAWVASMRSSVDRQSLGSSRQQARHLDRSPDQNYPSCLKPSPLSTAMEQHTSYTPLTSSPSPKHQSASHRLNRKMCIKTRRLRSYQQ